MTHMGIAREGLGGTKARGVVRVLCLVLGIASLGVSACASRSGAVRSLPQPAAPPYETHPHLYIHPGEPGYPPDDIPVDDILNSTGRGSSPAAR